MDTLGHPMIGATVFVCGTSNVAMTDANGVFRIEDLPVGEYTIEFRMIGMRSQTFDDIIIEEGSIIHLNAYLCPERYYLSDTVIIIKI